MSIAFYIGLLGICCTVQGRNKWGVSKSEESSPVPMDGKFHYYYFEFLEKAFDGQCIVDIKVCYFLRTR